MLSTLAELKTALLARSPTDRDTPYLLSQEEFDAVCKDAKARLNSAPDPNIRDIVRVRYMIIGGVEVRVKE